MTGFKIATNSLIVICLVALSLLNQSAFAESDNSSFVAENLSAYNVLTHVHSIYTFAGGTLEPTVHDMTRWAAENGFDGVIFTDYSNNMQREHLWLLGSSYSDDNGYANFSTSSWRIGTSNETYGKFTADVINDSSTLHLMAQSNASTFKVATARTTRTYMDFNAQSVILEFDANVTRVENTTNATDAYGEIWLGLVDQNRTVAMDLHVVFARDGSFSESKGNLILDASSPLNEWTHHEINITDYIIRNLNESAWKDNGLAYIEIIARSRNNATIEFYIKNLRLRTTTDFDLYKSDIIEAGEKYNITTIIGLEAYAKNKVHPMGAFLVFPVENWVNTSDMTVDEMMSHFNRSIFYPQYSTLYPDQLKPYTCKNGFSEVAQGQNPLIGLNVSGWTIDLASGCKVYAIAGANSRSEETIPPDDFVGKLQTKRFWNVVLAQNNSEQSILDAFRAGRFYLTNTFDITNFIFRTDDTLMGGTSKSTIFSIELASNGSKITEVALNSANGVVNEWKQTAIALKTTYNISTYNNTAGAYYVTAELADGRQLLSNPIWIEAPPAPLAGSSASVVLPVIYAIILLALIAIIAF